MVGMGPFIEAGAGRRIARSGGEERTNVLADPFFDRNRETAVGGHFKRLARRDHPGFGCSVDHNLAISGHDLHALCSGSAEMILAWIDQTEGFLLPIGHEKGVGNDSTIKIDVGLGFDGDIGE